MDHRRNSHPSRRQVVGGLAAGLASAVGAPACGKRVEGAAAGGEASGPEPASIAAAMAAVGDPRAAHAKPPFARQSQEWPGRAGAMSPRPDHGEGSYRGSGKLAGRKALITGGDSGIGRAAAIAYAREDADVAISYLLAEEPDAREMIEIIQAAGRKAVALPGDIRDEAFCGKLVADAVRELGGLDILVNNAARQQSTDLDPGRRQRARCRRPRRRRSSSHRCPTLASRRPTTPGHRRSCARAGHA